MQRRTKITASEFCSSVRDGTHDSPKEVFLGGKPLVTTKHLKNGKINIDQTYNISDEDFDNINKRSKVDKWDILISMIGTVGEVCLVEEEPDYAIKNLGLFKIGEEINSKWLYFYLKSKFGQNQIKLSCQGSTQQYISLKSLREFPIIIPNTQEEKKKIINILSSLEEKIKLNQKMNETLEEIAKTLFKSWFIDFDPVRAKAEGRSTGLSKEISDLFPNSFEESELGEIPSGWQIKNLGQILTFLGSGKRPKGGASITDDQVPSIGAENINFIGNYNYSNEKYVPRNFYETLREKGISIKNYDVLIYKDGANIGRSTIFGKGFPHKECTINEHAHLLRSEKENQKYLYFYLSTEHSQECLISLNTGSAQPGINQTQLKMLNILKPEKNILIKFDELVTPIIDLIFNNCLASNNLSNLRDTLLPKLISGEIKISDAESFIDEVGI